MTAMFGQFLSRFHHFPCTYETRSTPGTRVNRHSKLSAAVKGVIAGLGPYGYIVAMQAALQGAGKLPTSLPVAMRVGPK